MGSRSRFLALLPGLTLLILGTLVYWQFLFGGAVLLYRDIGSDSINSYYPDFVHLSNYIRDHGFPSWSFYVGMGQDLAYATGYLIWQPVSWLPSAWIAPALVFQHLAKVLLAGLFFFHFLQLRRLEWPAALLGSLLLSFSAYMCMGSCWYPFADEVVCFAALLWTIEKAVQRGRWVLLALPVALVGMITPFHLYLCALFLLFYVPIRLFAQHGWQPRMSLRICVALAAITVVGVGLGAVVTLPYLDAVLKSPRGSGATSAVAALSSSSFFGFETPLHYVTAALRPFSNDMLGTGDGFRGWQNYLEAPMTYCGLLCLLVVPQIFVRASRRHAVIFALFIAGMLVPTIFPWFRYLFWLFQGDYYRAHSLFAILGMITLSMIVFSRYTKGRALNLWLLGATTGAAIAVLYWPMAEFQTRINPALKQQAAIFLLLYGVLLAAGQLIRRQVVSAWLIVGVAALELIQFDRVTVSDRKTISKEELKERVGYNDETVDAVRDIKAGDNGFFRLTKLRPSGPSPWASLNDAMVFGFYGTSCYSSFNSVNYTEFLTAVDAIAPRSEAETRWAVGLVDAPILSLFAGEKYVLTDDPEPFQRALQYELVKKYGRDYLFRNARFVPFGLTFDRYISKDAFLQLRTQDKAETLLRVGVLSNTGDANKLGLKPASLSDLDDEIRISSLRDVVLDRRKTGLDITSFRQTRITGKVQLEQKSVLILQTPFAPGWHATEDGKPAPVFKVDIGLLGVGLDAGSHEVELSYRNPYLVASAAITLASFLLLAVATWKWPRLGLASEDEF